MDLVNPKNNQNWFYLSSEGATKRSLPSCKPKHPPSAAQVFRFDDTEEPKPEEKTQNGFNYF